MASNRVGVEVLEVDTDHLGFLPLTPTRDGKPTGAHLHLRASDILAMEHDEALVPRRHTTLIRTSSQSPEFQHYVVAETPEQVFTHLPSEFWAILTPSRRSPTSRLYLRKRAIVAVEGDHPSGETIIRVRGVGYQYLVREEGRVVLGMLEGR